MKSKLNITVKNIGLTNSMAFAPMEGRYDIEGLLKREGVIETIKNLSEDKSLTNDKFEFVFNNLTNTIFTCIKSARAFNFDESFW